MKISKQTVLVTGGSSGIGLELANTLLSQENTVLICGRSAEKLAKAKLATPALHTYPCDLSKATQCQQLMQQVLEEHPSLTCLINNAALVHKSDWKTPGGMSDKAALEVQTNLMAPLRLTEAFLTETKQPKSSLHIVNISTGLVYSPKFTYPFYCSTKAALHAHTQVIREQLKPLGIRVTEVLFPVVNTPWHQGTVPASAITPQQAVQEMLSGISKGKQEIAVGKVKLLQKIVRLSPKLASNLINRP